jgi:hypothetical protein
MVSEILTIGPLRSRRCQIQLARIMSPVTSSPITAAVFAAMTMLLYGCMAYDAASTVVGAGTTVVSTTADIVTSPFGSDDSEKK